MNKSFRAVASLAAVIFTVHLAAYATPPLSWKYLKDKSPHFKPCRTMSAEQVQRLQGRGALRQKRVGGLLAPQTKKLIVIRVDFPDGVITTSYNDADVFFGQLRQYYQENSYGLFTVTATITSAVYRLSNKSNYNNETDTALNNLRTDAVNAAGNDVDFNDYDFMMIYHSGYGEETTGNRNDIWSMYDPGIFTADGKMYYGFTVVPEKELSPVSALGVICHEFGHQLGLPDLYDTTVDGGRSVCGSWTLMDYAYGYDGTGANPPHLDPWCKDFLKFIDLSSRVSDQDNPNALLGDIETSQTTGFFKLPAVGSAGEEYFIVEYRHPDPAKVKFDLSLPGSGILIWHIDEDIINSKYYFNTINSGVPHYGIAIAAQGNQSSPHGNPSDVFGNGDIFSSPKSDTFSGDLTGIAIANILLSGARANFDRKQLAAGPRTTIDKIVNYPNPAGNGYPHPLEGKGILTTIAYHTPRPPREMSLTVYNMAGEKVATAQKQQFKLRTQASADYQWVLEYDWDGRNESGEKVAPGLYLYRIKADGELKVGKMAIVR